MNRYYECYILHSDTAGCLWPCLVNKNVDQHQTHISSFLECSAKSTRWSVAERLGGRFISWCCSRPCLRLRLTATQHLQSWNHIVVSMSCEGGSTLKGHSLDSSNLSAHSPRSFLYWKRDSLGPKNVTAVGAWEGRELGRSNDRTSLSLIHI